MNTAGLTITEAAAQMNVSTAAIYYHLKRRPELFETGPRGKTITIENLTATMKRGRAKAMAPAPAFRAAIPAQPAPITPATAPAHSPRPATLQAKPAPNTRIRNVGSWCKKCGDLMPGFRLDCRCLWNEMSTKAIERHKAENWLEAYVDISITSPGSRKA